MSELLHQYGKLMVIFVIIAGMIAIVAMFKDQTRNGVENEVSTFDTMTDSYVNIDDDITQPPDGTVQQSIN